MRLGIVVLLLALFSVVSCSTVSVKTDFDPEFDFTSVNSYRWADDSELHPDDFLASNTLVKKRLVASVNKAMAAKGVSQIESEDADLVIVMHAGVKEKMQVHNVPTQDPYPYPRRGVYRGWYDPWWGVHETTTHVSYYNEGTLVIDLVSQDNKELIWRGIGVKSVKDYRDSASQQQAFDKIVAEILAGFPPQAIP